MSLTWRVLPDFTRWRVRVPRSAGYRAARPGDADALPGARAVVRSAPAPRRWSQCSCAKWRDTHPLRLIFDLGNRRLLDVQCRRDVGLHLAGRLAERARALNLLPALPIEGIAYRAFLPVSFLRTRLPAKRLFPCSVPWRTILISANPRNRSPAWPRGIAVGLYSVNHRQRRRRSSYSGQAFHRSKPVAVRGSRLKRRRAGRRLTQDRSMRWRLPMAIKRWASTVGASTVGASTVGASTVRRASHDLAAIRRR